MARDVRQGRISCPVNDVHSAHSDLGKEDSIEHRHCEMR